eukprot:TRINITY_DN12372_c0_g1_i1.p1 TRINITY_DN12372_c0_g1~~TRINITY_DN12372_c0_g1_i1.p1  ORF type:complete len:201 (-),score=23.74 TRINITY_DN12372_c0_g1_i1:68-670(-)
MKSCFSRNKTYKKSHVRRTSDPKIEVKTEKPVQVIKLCALGTLGVGKTSLISRFAKNQFFETTSTLRVDFLEKHITVNGKSFLVKVWDTVGAERFMTLTNQFFRGAMGIFLVFDVSNQQSFQTLDTWIKNVNNSSTPNIKIMVIGNKLDLEMRYVDTLDAQEYCQSRGVDFIECSAKTGQNVNEAFERIVKKIDEDLDDD